VRLLSQSFSGRPSATDSNPSLEAEMSRIPGAALLVAITALLAACSGSTPTSVRDIDSQGPRRELTCDAFSGYVIAYDDDGVPYCKALDQS
jgi:hypothetical protein